MGRKSGIEWTDATWSPVTGCTRVSPGCERCYAERMAKRFGWPLKVTLHSHRLADPLRWQKPRRIFVCSQSDLFQEEVPDDFIGEVFSIMREALRHTFLVLTKRASRMMDFMRSQPPEARQNVWLGVSVEDRRAADERIPILLQIPAALRFVSCEPLLERVSLRRYLCGCRSCVPGGLEVKGELPSTSLRTCPRGIEWVIAGGESGYGARPCDPDWLRLLRDQCKEHAVPFFLKQLGGFPDQKGGNQALLDGQRWREMPEPAPGSGPGQALNPGSSPGQALIQGQKEARG